MAKEKYVLCRWAVNEIGEPKRYCGKSITKGDWCAEHWARLPFWPCGEVLDTVEDSIIEAGQEFLPGVSI